MIYASTDFAGIAALITAVGGTIAALIGVSRAQGKATKAEVETDKHELKLTNEMDRRARNEGQLDRLADTVAAMQRHVIDIIQSTADQSEKVTALLADCEKRHSEKDGLIHDLRGEVRELAGEVASIKSKVGAE